MGTGRTVVAAVAALVSGLASAVSVPPPHAVAAATPGYSADSAGPGPATPVTPGDGTTFGESPPGEVTGDGRYRQPVPVSVPPFHGLEPEIGLEYDTRRGNGVAGWGWALTGDSTIRRHARGGRGAPALDDTDDYLLDGQRLVPCAKQPTPGISCRRGGTHSTERETFRRITREGDQWLVWDTDGVRSTYTSAAGNAHDVVFALSERRNPHGDAVRYGRWCDGTDECYLGEVEYQDAADPAKRTRIKLHYEKRPDPATTGITAALITSRWRLLTIWVGTAGQVRSALALRYATGGVTRLDGVTRYGRDATLDSAGRVTGGTALPGEAFGWLAGDIGPQAMTTATPIGDAPPEVIRGTGPAYDRISKDTGLAFADYYGAKQWLTGDLDGDGRDDVIGALTGPDRPQIVLDIQLGEAGGALRHRVQTTAWPSAGYVIPKKNDPPTFVSKFRLLTGDINGDGRDDLVNVWWDTSGGAGQVVTEAYLGTATGYLAPAGKAGTGLTSWSARQRWFLGDADGDGLADLLSVHGVGGGGNDGDGWAAAELLVVRSDGEKFAHSDTTSTSWTFERRDDPHWFVGDADGDGRADLLGVESVTGSGTAALRLAVSSGDGRFTTFRQPTSVPYFSPLYAADWDFSRGTAVPNEVAHAGDFDGDGRTDLLLVAPVRVSQEPGADYQVHFTTAFAREDQAFEIVDEVTDLSPAWLNTYELASWGVPLRENRWLVGDVDGDGRTDLMLTRGRAEVFDTDEWPTTVRLRVARSTGDGGWEFGRDVLTDWSYWCYENSPVEPLVCHEGPPTNDLLTGDLNGDGRADLVYAGTGEQEYDGNVRLAAWLAPNTVADTYRYQVGDVTGDGREDGVYLSFTNPGLVAYTAIANGDAAGGSRLVRKELTGAAGFAEPDMRRWIAADYGSPAGGPDGRLDFLHLHQDPATDTLRFTLLLSKGDGDYLVVDDTAPGTEKDPDVRSWIPVDANGDGVTDLARFTPVGTAAVTSTLLADGHGGWQRVPGQIPMVWPLGAPARLLPTDVDGDGLGDLVHVNVQTTAQGQRFEAVTSVRSAGNGTWARALGYSLAGHTGAVAGWRPASANGDGPRDLIRVAHDRPSATTPGKTRVDRLLSQGQGGYHPAGVDLGIADFMPGWSQVDNDADGCDELAWVNPGWQADPGRAFVRRISSDCATLTPLRTALTAPAPALPGWRAIDATGDTSAQLVRWLPGADGPARARLPLGTVPRLVRTLDSGLGRRITLGYRSSAGNQDNLPPHATITVVASKATSPGNATGSGTSRYTYANLRYSYPLRRLLGFRQVTETGDRAVTTTGYALTPGCAGSPATRAIYPTGSGGDLLSATSTRYQDASASGGPAPWTCLPEQQVEQECAGAANCRELATRYGFDDYGNQTTLDELGAYRDDDHDGRDDAPADNRLTRTTYQPDTGRYLAAFPATRQVVGGDGAVADERRWTYDANTAPDQPPTVGDATVAEVFEPHLGRFLATRYGHDGHGNVLSETDAAGRVTTTVFDPTYARFPEQSCTKLWCTVTEWDTVLGRPKKVTDPNNRITNTRWDALGRHDRTDYPDGGCLAHTYPSWGTAVSQAVVERTCATAGGDGTNGYLSRTYFVDGLHRAWRDDRPGGYTRNHTFAFDTTLLRTETSWHAPGQPAGTTTYAYDALDRLRSTVRPDLSAVTYTYGPGSEARTDATARTTLHRRDGLGRVTRVEETGTGAPALVTVLGYDPLDQLRSSVDARGHRTTWDRGPLGWVWQECDPDRGCVDRGFDDTGRRSSEFDATGAYSRWAYDPIGRITGRTYHDAKGAVLDKATWAYDRDPVTGTLHGDSIGRVTETYRQASDARVQRWYDSRGRPTQERTCVAGQCLATETGWNAAGTVGFVRYPDASGQLSSQSEQVSYGYDAAGRVRSASGYVTDIGYAADDQPARFSYANQVVETIQHDAKLGWADDITLSGMAGAWPTLTTTYHYDLAGRLVGQDRSSPVGHQHRYAYDAYGRLEAVTGSHPEQFRYDELGRLTRRSTVGDYTYGDPSHVHAVTGAGSDPYTYDAAGRALTGPGGTTYDWDTGGNLTGVTTPAGGTGYGYDADDRRVSRRTSAGATVYGGALVERDPAGDLIRSYRVGDRVVARSHWSWGVWFYHADRQGSIAAITDELGQPVQYYDYQPYGGARPAQQAVHDELRYTGAREDPDNGLLDLGARMYDPALGRFLSPDSVTPDPLRTVGYDRYGYGYADPLNTVDPGGHAPRDLTAEPDPVRVSTAPRSARLLDKELTLVPETPEGATAEDDASSRPRWVDRALGMARGIDQGQAFQFLSYAYLAGAWVLKEPWFMGMFSGGAGFGAAMHGIFQLMDGDRVHGGLNTAAGVSSMLAGWSNMFAAVAGADAALWATRAAAGTQVGLFFVAVKLTYDYVQWLLTDPMGDSRVVRQAREEWDKGNYTHTPLRGVMGHRY